MYTLRISLTSIKKFNKFKIILLKLKKLNIFKNIKIKGIFKVKQKKNIFTILRSPHVNKKSQEHFIYKNYKQKIDIKFDDFYQLLNLMIFINKILTENKNIQFKIIKN